MSVAERVLLAYDVARPFNTLHKLRPIGYNRSIWQVRGSECCLFA